MIEATGDAQVMADTLGMLRRNGVACLLGLDPRRAGRAGRPVIGVDAILENRVVFGSVNANRSTGSRPSTRSTGPAALARAPTAFVGLRVPLDRFGEAFDHDGVKATLVLDDSL